MADSLCKCKSFWKELTSKSRDFLFPLRHFQILICLVLFRFANSLVLTIMSLLTVKLTVFGCICRLIIIKELQKHLFIHFCLNVEGPMLWHTYVENIYLFSLRIFLQIIIFRGLTKDGAFWPTTQKNL